MTTRRQILAAAAAAAGSTLASPARAGGVTDKEILIGTHLDLSGPVAAGMPHLRNGTQMRIDEINEAGGIHGRRLRLIVEDNGSQPQMAVRAVDKLLRSDDVFAVVNAFGSGTNAATVKRIGDAGVLNFAPWGASAVLQKVSGNHPLLFTTVPNYHVTMDKGVNWAIRKFGAKRVGYIYQEGPLGELMGSGVKSAVKANSLELVAEAAYKPGDIDFSSQVARMRAANTDLIVIATITRETVGIMSEVKKLGWNNVSVLTGSPGRTGIVLQLGKDNVQGLYGVGSWKAGTDAPEAAAWKASFTKRFNNMEPDENALLAYVYADWLFKAVAAAGRDLNAEKVARTLQSMEYTDNGLIFYKPVRFKANHITPEPVQVDQAQGAKWVPAGDLVD